MALCFHHAWVSWKVSFLFLLNVLIVIISDFVVLTILSLHRVFYFEINLLLAILVSVFLPGSICSSQHDLNSVKNILCVFSPHSRAASGQLLKHLLWAKWTHEHCLEWLRSAPAAMQPYHNIDISCKTWVQVYYHYRLFCSLFNFFFPFFHFMRKNCLQVPRANDDIFKCLVLSEQHYKKEGQEENYWFNFFRSFLCQSMNQLIFVALFPTPEECHSPHYRP